MRNILLGLSFLFILNSHAYKVVNTITVNSGGGEIVVGEGEVYIDGVKAEEYMESLEEQPEYKEEKVVQEEIYRSKNVDAYNKWYNNKIKKDNLKKKKTSEEDYVCNFIIGFIGFCVIVALSIFLFRRISRIVRERRYNKPKIENKTVTTNISKKMPEIKSPIKNKDPWKNL